MQHIAKHSLAIYSVNNAALRSEFPSLSHSSLLSVLTDFAEALPAVFPGPLLMKENEAF